jgi:hypothetical protein
MKKKREMQGNDLLDAFANNNKSLEEIIAFMKDNKQNEA